MTSFWCKRKWFLVLSSFRNLKKWPALHGNIEKPQFNGAAHSLNYHNFTAHLKKKQHKSNNTANNANTSPSLCRCHSFWKKLQTIFFHSFFLKFTGCCSFLFCHRRRHEYRFRWNVKSFDIWKKKYENGFKSLAKRKTANVQKWKKNNYFISNEI